MCVCGTDPSSKASSKASSEASSKASSEASSKAVVVKRGPDPRPPHAPPEIRCRPEIGPATPLPL